MARTGVVGAAALVLLMVATAVPSASAAEVPASWSCEANAARTRMTCTSTYVVRTRNPLHARAVAERRMEKQFRALTGEDELAHAVASLFQAEGQRYQATAAMTAAFHEEFVRTLSPSAPASPAARD